MRADEALKQSKDGIIYFNGQAARVDAFNILWWDNGGVVSLTRIFADNWQPSKPVKMCAGCDAAGRLDENLGVGTLQADHLRSFHCTCKKEV